MRQTLCIVCALLLALAARPCLAQEDVSKASLGIYGCYPFGEIVSNADGGFLVASCRNVSKGVYYSTDFGSTWSFAAGGDYTRGSAYRLVMTGTHVYMAALTVQGENLVVPGLYRMALPTSGSWTPQWEQIGYYMAYDITIHGNTLYLLDNYTKVVALDLTSLAEVQQVTLPAGSVWGNVVASSSSLYVVGSTGSAARVLKGSLGSNGVFGDLGDVPNMPSDKILRFLRAAPNGNLIFNFGYTNGTLDGLYQSTDGLLNWMPIATGSVSGYTACFRDNTFLVGAHISLDGGQSWNPFTPARLHTSRGDISIVDNGCVFHPTQPGTLLKGVMRGLLKTTQFGDTTPLWTDANAGIEGVSVQDMAQAPGNKDRVVVSTNVGIASTLNFTSSAPAWDWSCPGGICTQYGYAAPHPSNPDIFFAQLASIVYKGTVSANNGVSEITWEELARSPFQTSSGSAVRSHPSLPDAVAVSYFGYSSENTFGGVCLYNIADGTTVRCGLGGKPVRDLILINATTFFATAGSEGALNPSADSQGIFKTTDAGATWTRMDDADLGTAYFQKFAYDDANDILYTYRIDQRNYSANPPRIFRLSGAAAGNSDWVAGAVSPKSYFTALAVDRATGKVYTGGSGYIWVSIDQGDSLVEIVAGAPLQQTHFLYFDALLEGHDSGLTAVGEPAVRCTLKRPKKGKNSLAFEYVGLQPTAELEYRATGKKTWKRLSQKMLTRTRAYSAAAAIKLKKNKLGSYRMKTSDCTSKIVKVR